MKKINVAAALIIKDKKVLIAKRMDGEYAGYWEFPGGKIEHNESSKNAIKREIKEELNLEISVDSFFHKVEYHYPTFHLSMECFICTIKKGELELFNHSEIRWIDVTKKDHTICWIPADTEVYEKLIQRKESSN